MHSGYVIKDNQLCFADILNEQNFCGSPETDRGQSHRFLCPFLGCMLFDLCLFFFFPPIYIPFFYTIYSAVVIVFFWMNATVFSGRIFLNLCYVQHSVALYCTCLLILTNLNKVGYAAGNIYIKFVAFFLGKWPANFTSSLLMCHRFWECIVYICFGEAVYIFTFPITLCAIWSMVRGSSFSILYMFCSLFYTLISDFNINFFFLAFLVCLLRSVFVFKRQVGYVQYSGPPGSLLFVNVLLIPCSES